MFDYDAPDTNRFSPWSQFAILLCLCGAGLFIGGLISIPVALSYLHVSPYALKDALLKSENVNLSRALQFITTFFLMAVPAFVFARIISRKPFNYVGFNTAISGKQVFIVVCMVMIGLVISASLSQVNEMIPISKSAAAYFKGKEDEYNKEVFAIANMKTMQDYVMSLIIIALLPALFEEMLFRGSLQPVLVRITKNAFAGILITSIIFSAVHGSYYGFLPRLALSLILGYIYYFSKNLWLNVLLHFLNNAIGITQLYALSKHGKLDLTSMNDTSIPIYYLLIAAGAIYFAFKYFKQESDVVISMHNLEQ